MFKTVIIYREKREVDTGTMGFHDYETRWEDLIKFVNRVTDMANELNENESVKNIQFFDDKAIILYINNSNNG